MHMHSEPRIASAVDADDEWSRRGFAVGKRGSGVNHDFYAMHPVPIGDRYDIGDRKLGMEVVRLGIGLELFPIYVGCRNLVRVIP